MDRNQIFDALINASSDGFIALDGQNRIRYINNTAINIFSANKKKLIDEKITKLSLLFRKSGILHKYIDNSSAKNRSCGEEKIPSKSGGEKAYFIKSFAIKNGIGLIFSNITRHNSMLDQLQNSEQHYKNMVEFLPEIVYQIDPKGLFTYLNQNVCCLGYTPEELLGKHFTTIIKATTTKQITRATVLPKYRGKSVGEKNAPKLFDERRTGERRTKYLEVKLIHKKDRNKKSSRNISFYGEVTSSGLYSAPLVNDKKKFLGTIGIIKDITERKIAEKEITILISAISQSIDGIAISDLSAGITYANEAFAIMHNCDTEQVIGTSVKEFLSGIEHKDFKAMLKEICSEGSWEGELRHFKYGVSLFPTYSSITLLKDESQNPAGILWVFRDITEQKETQEKIRASLKEKEVLLKEIHHRVKNNLQVISSLLRIQSGQIKNITVSEVFKETQNRIQAMALIHEKLYRSGDLANIDFSEYITSLTSNLYNSYRVLSNSIKMNIDVDNLFLNLDTAIPVGLIINELLSNSLKHAFPKKLTPSMNGNGQILVKLHVKRDNLVSYQKHDRLSQNKPFMLIVSDNGIGLPDDIDFRNCDSMGLQVVITLVEQLGGKIEMIRDYKQLKRINHKGKRLIGTTFKIEF